MRHCFTSNIDTYEYLSNESCIAILGDSCEILSQLKSNSVHLIFADAPYGIGKDFGNNFDSWKSAEDYLAWCQIWIAQCMRVLKEDGTMYLMSSTQYMPILDRYIDQHYHIINRIVWTYDSSGVQSKKRFGSLYEPILMFTHHRKSQYVFNYQDIMVEAKTGAKRKLIDYRKTPPQPYNHLKVPGNVWDFNRVRYKMHEYENHPTQKPESLLARVILASSSAGDIVLDPFSGSFTTACVALKYDRKAIGIDLNREYFEIGLRRTQLADDYQGQRLVKTKRRKTKHKSKKDHII